MDLQKNDDIEATIESLGYRGEGVARIDRVPVFVSGALPGERVRAHVLLVKKDFAVAKLTEVVAPSPRRVAPVCPYFGKCGGCDLQHLAYGAQLDFKRDHVRDTLRKIARQNAEVAPCVPSAAVYGYRNKLSLPVRRGRDGNAAVGLFAYNSHRVVEIDDCPLQTERIRAVIPDLRALAARFSPYDEERGVGVLRHLVVRDLGGRLSLTAVATRDIASQLAKACAELGVAADELWLNINTSQGNAIMGDRTVLIGGRQELHTVMGLPTSVHPKGFLQVNAGVANALYGALLAKAQELAPTKIVDAYSGGGTLTALLAVCAREVVGVEIEPAASAAADELAARLQLTNVRNICGDCAAVLPSLISGADERTLILLDPPRGGCDRAVTAAVNDCDARDVLYVSCNPATLARDLALLDNYTVLSVTPYDMFPQTCHVETLVCLQRK